MIGLVDAFVCLLRRQPQPNKQTIEGISMKHNPKSLASFENQDAAQGRGEQFSSDCRPSEWVKGSAIYLCCSWVPYILLRVAQPSRLLRTKHMKIAATGTERDAYLYIVDGRPCATHISLQQSWGAAHLTFCIYTLDAKNPVQSAYSINNLEVLHAIDFDYHI